MKKLKSLESFKESSYVIKSREAQRAILGGYTIYVSHCGSANEDFQTDTEEETALH